MSSLESSTLLGLQKLQKTLNYEWCDGDLLRRALTHSSYGNVHKEQHNETLEFLGDSVLDLITAEWLMACYPSKREGFMSQQRALLVQKGSLARHARRLEVDQALLLGPKDNYLRQVDSVLADALEAIVGALYQDCRSISTVRERLLAWKILGL